MTKLIIVGIVCFVASAFFYGLAEGLFPDAGPIVPIVVSATGAIISSVVVLRVVGRARARSIAAKPEYLAEGLELDTQTGRLLSGRWCPGRLFLTKQRIVFDSVAGNHHVDIQLTDIRDVHARNMLFDRCLEIVDKRGERLRFSLPERDRAIWSVALERAIESAKPGVAHHVV